MNALKAFQFSEGDTFLHRLDPRAKLVLTLSLVVYLWLRADLLVMLLAIPPLALVVGVGGVWRDTRGSLRAYAILAVVLIPLNVIFHSKYTPPGVDEAILVTIADPGTPLVGGLYITWEAVEFSLMVYLRLVLMLVAASIFLMTTSLDDLQALLLKFRFPYFFVLTLGFAFRFVPTLAEEAQRIREAQMARGLELQKGNVLRRYWKSVIPMIFPLMVSALRKALLFAEALEARATFVNPRRTSLVVLRFRGSDAVAVSLSIILLSVALYYIVIQPVF